jgi:hypothetical protein
VPPAAYEILDLGVRVTSDSRTFLEGVEADYTCFRVEGEPAVERVVARVDSHSIPNSSRQFCLARGLANGVLA